MSSRGGDEPRGGGREGAPGGGAVPARVEQGRTPRGSWPLLLLVVLLLAVLIIAVLFLWRSLGDDLSGSSIAKDSIDSGTTPHVRVVNGPGQVRVEGVKGINSVVYEVTRHAVAGDPAAAKERASRVPVDLAREDSAIVLETDGGRNTGADYTLRVPSGTSVEVESEAGDVEVSGLSGSVSVLAEAGDVTVRDVGNAVTVEAPQGDVAVRDASTDTGQAELEVGSGDVTLEDVVVGTLEARVEAGDVTLSGRFSGGGRVYVETGDITVNLPPEDTRDLTLEASIGEVVRQDPSEEPASEGAPREGG